MQVEVFAYLDSQRDMIELDDDLTEEEIEQAVYDYVSEFFDWGYIVVEKED